MTKNLKLKIKNFQLAQAAGLDKLKAKLAKKPGDKHSLVDLLKVKNIPSIEPSPSLPEENKHKKDTPRIRAKSRSSFGMIDKPDEFTSEEVVLSSVSKEVISVENEKTSVKLDEAKEIFHCVEEKKSINILKNEPITTQFSKEKTFPTSSVEIHSVKEEISNVPLGSFIEKTQEVTPQLNVSASAKAPLVTITPPKPFSVVKERYGPTGRHVKQLLTRPPLPPKTEETTSAYPRVQGLNEQNKGFRPKTWGTSSNAPTAKPQDASVTNKTTAPKKDFRKPQGIVFKDVRQVSRRGPSGAPAGKGSTSWNRRGSDGDDDKWRKRRSSKGKSFKEDTVTIYPSNLKIVLPIMLKDLAADMKLKASEIIQKLFIHGMVYVVNDILDDETVVQFIGSEFGCDIQIDTSEKERIQITAQTIREEIASMPVDDLVTRPLVVAFMGHVDHGKTSLIDAIRHSNVASGEAGSITQHIGAFSCSTPSGNLTILDTPGHEAFSAMRSRGAEVGDIVVLVVSGEEGFKEQTLEAIEHTKKAGITIVVAINKSDRPNFDPELVYRQLANINLLPEAWGGQIATVNTSAITGDGITELLETLILQAEVLELRANPSFRPRGVVIESQLHKGLGFLATVLVLNGTLKQGDAIVFEECYGRIKTMRNEKGISLIGAEPSMPVEITGLSALPSAGDSFIGVKNEKLAKEIVEARLEGKQRFALQQKKKPLIESLMQNKIINKKDLNLVIRADVQGSLEALVTALKGVISEKVSVEIVSDEVGEISESDIRLAFASSAMIIGFHTGIESHADPLIKELGVSVFLNNIIYHIVDHVKLLMKNLLDPLKEEHELGKAEVKAVFKSSRLGLIGGCLVTEGIIGRNHKLRVKRDGEVIWKGSMLSLKREKEDLKDAKKGFECGILLDGFNQLQLQDIIESYEIKYVPQEL
ncbi:Translation initiation factor IF-2 [Candidatus Clavichlamydia salmonicola]|uniref:translation initiation factor IF-2 n=1 Tax=Candidatus Clavichlamydia salmonicola TaxID=469812 RepID=UPI001891CF1E|nr:translation initiation factor IF-2 [Candidatus Clavichlamydia salmonicola]MBF5051196.1 Translation initiation factor IF-2 [Candidatus Clavichlamydia salmonicola]